MNYRDLLKVLQEMTDNQLDTHVVARDDNGYYIPIHDVVPETKEFPSAAARQEHYKGTPILTSEYLRNGKHPCHLKDYKFEYGQLLRGTPIVISQDFPNEDILIY